MIRRLLLLAPLALTTSALAGDTPQGATAPSNPALERLKALAGDWTMAGGDGSVAASWRVISNGAAVTETLFPGTPHEMLTVYHLDGKDLVLTHYCAAGNQPRMKATSTSGDTLSFTFTGGTNVDPRKTGHMHDAVLTLGPDTLHEDWSYWEGGKKTDGHAFDLVRKRG